MYKPVAEKTGETATHGAIGLMVKLTMLVAASLLFASHGIREGRTQPVGGTEVRSPLQGRVDRVDSLQRDVVEDRPAAAAPAAREVPLPAIGRP